MPVICVVRVPCAIEKVLEVEAAHPEIMQQVFGAGMKYVTNHQRIADENEVLELNEYASREDYDAFMEEAGPAIRQIDEFLGAPAVDKVYTVVEDD